MHENIMKSRQFLQTHNLISIFFKLLKSHFTDNSHIIKLCDIYDKSEQICKSKLRIQLNILWTVYEFFHIMQVFT